MEEAYRRPIRQLTSVALVTSAILVGLGFAGLSPSLPFVVGTLVLTGLAFAARERVIAAAPNEPTAVHAETLWIGPALAAAVLVLFGDLTPGELQTVGALVGLFGMVHYLLRPVYALVAVLIARVSRAA